MECICGGNLAALTNLAVRGSCGSEKRTPPLCSRPEAPGPPSERSPWPTVPDLITAVAKSWCRTSLGSARRPGGPEASHARSPALPGPTAGEAGRLVPLGVVVQCKQQAAGPRYRRNILQWLHHFGGPSQ